MISIKRYKFIEDFHFLEEDRCLLFASRKEVIPIIYQCVKITPIEQIIKETTKVVAFKWSEGKKDFFIKAYCRRKGLASFFEFFRKPRALRTLEKYLLFREAGFKTLVPLGGWVNLQKKSEFPSGLLFDFLPFEKKAGFLFKQSPSKVLSYLSAILRYLYEMHEKGFYIRDPKLSNFFILDGKVVLVDLDSLRYTRRPLNSKLRLKNLSVLTRSLSRIGMKEEADLVPELYFSFKEG